MSEQHPILNASAPPPKKWSVNAANYGVQPAAAAALFQLPLTFGFCRF